MKNYSPKHESSRVVIPVVSKLPEAIEIGELVYLMATEFPGFYVYIGGRRWESVSNTRNNVFETHEAVKGQQIFELSNYYPTDGNSINVYVQGRRLAKSEYAEVGNKTITIKDNELLQGGEIVEFQMFNLPIGKW
jgi:hypothetical protein